MPTVIQVENLSKQYRLGQIGARTIREDLNRFWARARGKEDPTLKIGQTNTLTRNSKLETRNSDYVWALKDINFSVQQGEVLGIIGKNGAGKSTLLKILSKVTSPTTGTITIIGRIASLLEVGTGFHPELSGRENVFLNGAILGMSKAEIRSKFDEIVDFSGVENYIDTPVKRYSSGMYVRLAFAVAAHLEPEILIVDEVLAVGDAEFQKKCLGKMKDVSSQGRTVLFVSHNMPSVMELCSRGIILKDGQISYGGDIKSVVDQYLNINLNENKSRNLKEITNRSGNGRIRFTKYKILDTEGKEIEKIVSGQNIAIQIYFEVHTKEVLPPLHFSLHVVKEDNTPLFHISNSITNGEEFKFDAGSNKGSVTCEIEGFPLQSGKYFFNLFCSDMYNVYDSIDFAGVLQVEPGNFFSSGRMPLKSLGDFLVSNKWSIEVE